MNMKLISSSSLINVLTTQTPNEPVDYVYNDFSSMEIYMGKRQISIASILFHLFLGKPKAADRP